MLINTKNHLLIVAAFLTLCIVSFMHLFVFSLYNVDAGYLKKRVSIVADYDYMLCWVRTNRWKHKSEYRKKVLSKQQCPRDGIVTVYQGGRLGNQMFEYAGVWAVARRTGLDPYVPECIRQRLDKVFEKLSVPILTEILHCPMHSVVHSLDQWTHTNQSIVLPQYYQELEVLCPWLHDLRSEFKLKSEFIIYAQQTLHIAKKKLLKYSKHPDANITYVGVHVRRDDYGVHLSKFQLALVGPDYFFQAMEYFETKYNNVLFVIISDDPGWCQKYLVRRANIVVVSKKKRIANSAEKDLAVMTQCNHSIIDYGTYGTWGAILAGGETIVHNISSFWTSTKMAEMLPTWQLL